MYSINSVNPLYLIFKKVDAYVEEKENGDRYLNISLVKDNNEVINKFNSLWKGIKDWILKINGSVKEYDKDYKKIKSDSDENLPLNTVIKFHALTVIVRCIIEKNNKYYPEIYLDDALYELKRLEYKKIDISEGIDTDKSHNSKECSVCHFW